MDGFHRVPGEKPRMDAAVADDQAPVRPDARQSSNKHGTPPLSPRAVRLEVVQEVGICTGQDLFQLVMTASDSLQGYQVLGVTVPARCGSWMYPKSQPSAQVCRPDV